MNDSKTLYRIVRELTAARGNTTALDKGKNNRTLLMGKEQAAKWVEHYWDSLNQLTTSCMFEFNDSITHQQLNLNLREVTRSEIQRTIKSMKNNKVPGIDEIPAELLNHGKNSITAELTHLSNRTWTAEDALGDWSEE